MGYTVSLNNLKGELVRKGVKQKDAAKYLDMTASNFNKKLSETIPFTIDEIKKLRDRYFPHADLNHLLESDGDVPTEREKDKAQLDAIEDILDEIDACPEFYEALADMRAEHEA